MDILNEERRSLKSQQVPVRAIPLIDLENENVSSKPQVVASVDLTEAESEIIVLDETFNQLNRTLSNLDVTFSSFDDVVYLGTINTSKPYTNQIKNCESDVTIVNSIKIGQDKSSSKINVSSSNLVTPGKINSMLKNGRLRRKSQINGISNSTLTAQNKKVKTGKKAKRSRTPSSQNKTDVSVDNLHDEDMPPKKKRKLKNIGNNSLTTTPPAKPLSGNILKYYAQIEKAVDKIKKSDKKKKKCKNLTPAKKLKKQRQQEIKKKTKNNNIKGKKKIKLSPQKRLAIHEDSIKSSKEANIFNPNPIDVEKEGLRPIIIDGCNVAIGHGRGKFSVKGLQICVDYFVNRGHDHIKVFLPLHRQGHFRQEELVLLKSKCDVVFTPSRKVNGVIKTSYDDRFIVQYAAEFEGVIVSTDNYRDLLIENSRWHNTIQQRLLMFTWVDDFLMFPMDPLGRKGPTLDQFLKF